MKSRIDYARRVRRRQSDARARKICSHLRHRGEIAGTHKNPCLANQRLRLLSRNTHKGRPRPGRNRATIYALKAWRETPFFTEKERAALAWAESVTQLSASQVPNDVYEIVREYFDETEIVNITTAIVAINGWNRFAVSFRSVPDNYQPEKH